MTTPLPTLDYARRRKRRRPVMIALLVLAALAVGLVGRALYLRLEPIVRAQWLQAHAEARLQPTGKDGPRVLTELGADGVWQTWHDPIGTPGEFRWYVNRLGDSRLYLRPVEVRRSDDPERRRIVLFALDHNDLGGYGHLTVLVQVVEPGGFWGRARLIGTTHYLSMGNLPKAFRLRLFPPDPADPLRLRATVESDISFENIDIYVTDDDRVVVHRFRPATAPAIVNP